MDKYATPQTAGFQLLFQLQKALQEFDFLQDAEPDWYQPVEITDSTANTPLSTPLPSPLVEFPQDEVFYNTY